jgi:hypothetical protein
MRLYYQFLLCFLAFGYSGLVLGADSNRVDIRSLIDFYHKLPDSLRSITNLVGDEIRSVTGDITFIKEIEMQPRNDQDVMSIVLFMAQQNERKLVVGAGNFKSGSGGWQGLSIGGHAQGMKGDVYLSTRKLKTDPLGSFQAVFNPDDESLFITVKAGDSWEEVMQLANSTLSREHQEKFQYVPFSAPTSASISIAGSLTSHGHSRTSAFGGGYMPQSVLSFSLVTMQSGEVTKLLVSAESNPELFYALPGSFGRGGVVTEVTLKLQRIPKNTRVRTTITKYDNPDDLVNDYNDMIQKLKADEIDPYQRPFASCFVSVTATGSYYLYSTSLVVKEAAHKYPYFDFFEKPGVISHIIQDWGHNKTRAANSLVDVFITGNRESKTYKNHPVTWIFAQDSFLKYMQHHDKRHSHPMVLAHQAYVFKGSLLAPVLDIAKKLQKNYADNYGLACKMEDIVPLNGSPFLMAPAYQAKEDLFIYTFTWPIRKQTQKEGVLKFREEFLKLCDESQDIGPNMVRSHMLKEFEKDSLLIFNTYKAQVSQLKKTLKAHDIDDSFMWNNVFGTLFQVKRGSGD